MNKDADNEALDRFINKLPKEYYKYYNNFNKLLNEYYKLKGISPSQQGGKKQFIRSEDNKKYKNKCIYTKPKGKTEYVKHNKQFITLKQFQKLK